MGNIVTSIFRPVGVEEARFNVAEKAWRDMHARTPHCNIHAPSAFMMPKPDACDGTMRRLGRSGDGGWDVCDNPTMHRKGCVAYLLGAGTDIAFDIELARGFPQCEVLTIDPTPGIAERLRNLDGVLEMLPHKQSLAHKLRTDGLPHNWRHVNVGVSHREEQQWWGTTASWRSRAPQKGARLTHQKNAYATMRFNSSGAVRLRPLTAIMREFGHTSVDIIKLDVVRTAPSGSRPGCEVE